MPCWLPVPYWLTRALAVICMYCVYKVVVKLHPTNSPFPLYPRGPLDHEVALTSLLHSPSSQYARRCVSASVATPLIAPVPSARHIWGAHLIGFSRRHHAGRMCTVTSCLFLTFALLSSTPTRMLTGDDEVIGRQYTTMMTSTGADHYEGRFYSTSTTSYCRHY